MIIFSNSFGVASFTFEDDHTAFVFSKTPENLSPDEKSAVGERIFTLQGKPSKNTNGAMNLCVPVVFQKPLQKSLSNADDEDNKETTSISQLKLKNSDAYSVANLKNKISKGNPALPTMESSEFTPEDLIEGLVTPPKSYFDMDIQKARARLP